MAKSKDPSRSPSLSTESQDVIEQAEQTFSGMLHRLQEALPFVRIRGL